jgi:hypothetical protein
MVLLTGLNSTTHRKSQSKGKKIRLSVNMVKRSRGRVASFEKTGE